MCSYPGMCYKCGEKVFGEGSGCTAMEHVYHISCFTCHICHKELRGKPFYAKDGKPFCEDDYLNTLEKCCVCGGRILDRILRATGKPYHPNC
ncbi:Lipoma-preferred partner, partial [Araneus ventricosus]